MGVEEPGERFGLAFARLPEDPARCLLDQVLSILDQDFGHLDRRFDLTPADRPQGRDDRHPPTPEIRGCGQPLRGRPEPAFGDLAPEEPRCRDVDQIPVVDTVEVVQIETGQAASCEVGPSPVAVDKDPQGHHPVFVDLAPEQTADRAEFDPAHLPRDPVEVRSPDADEPVALGVLSRSGPEEPRKPSGRGRIGERPDPLAHLPDLVLAAAHGSERTGEPPGRVPE